MEDIIKGKAYRFHGDVNEAIEQESSDKAAAQTSDHDHLLGSPANAAHLAESIQQSKDGRVQARDLIEPV